MQKEETLIDHCRLPNLLNEFYCNEKGYIEQRTIQCQCNNGACKQNNIQTTTCSDSDGGINYNTYGVVSFGSGTDIAGMFFDTCEGIILTEGYCGTNNNLQTTTISCKYGCNNGACIQQEYNTVAYGVIDEYIKLSTKMTAIYPNENIKIYFEGIIMPKCAAITCVPQAVFRITTNLPVDITEEDLETTEYSDDAKTIYLAEGKTYNLEAYVLKLYELTDNKAVIALHKNVNEELKCAPGCKEVPEGCLCPKIKVKKTLSGYDIEIGTKQTNAREIIITPGAGSITAVLDNDVAQELEVNSITDEGIALTLYNDKKVKVYTDKKLLKTYLSDDETTAETQMTIKGRDEGLTAETSFGSKAIKVSPSEASNAAKSTLSATYADIKLKEKDSDIIYELNGKLPIKILGIIPVEAKVTTTINAETGDVIDVDTPWYTTISRE